MEQKVTSLEIAKISGKCHVFWNLSSDTDLLREADTPFKRNIKGVEEDLKRLCLFYNAASKLIKHPRYNWEAADHVSLHILIEEDARITGFIRCAVGGYVPKWEPEYQRIVIQRHCCGFRLSSPPLGNHKSIESATLKTMASLVDFLNEIGCDQSLKEKVNSPDIVSSLKFLPLLTLDWLCKACASLLSKCRADDGTRKNTLKFEVSLFLKGWMFLIENWIDWKH